MRLGLAWRLARRELRGGLRGFWIFLGCLILGVGAIATVSSLSSGVEGSLREDGRAILGGDVEAELARRTATEDELALLTGLGAVSTVADARAMARAADGDGVARVEVKAVDAAYPLYGELLLDGADRATALGQVGGVWGVAVESTLLAGLDINVGDQIRLGEETYEVRATIVAEPDRASGGFSIGARVLMTLDAFDASNLIQPGSLIDWQYRVRLDGVSPDQAIERLRDGGPEAGWRLRDYSQAAPQLQEMIDRLTLFLVLVGLTALLVGGVGVSNAVRAFLERRVATIATLKCLGAEGPLVFAIYLIQVAALALLGIAVGLGVGAGSMVVVGGAISNLLPIDVRVGIYPDALVLAGVFGLLTALAFSLWPLARARDIAAAGLFRSLTVPVEGWPRAGYVVATLALFVSLAGLAIATAQDPWFAFWFVAGAIGAVIAFRLAAVGIMAGVRRLPRPRRIGLRLAVSNLVRPGAPTAMIVLSLGLGLTVLVAIALIEGNMARQVRDARPDAAADFFMVDIQPDQVGRVAAIVEEMDGIDDLVTVPSLRARIVAANGVPAREALQDPGESWLIEGDRGLTYAADVSERYEIIAGEWWPPDYQGPPLISVYEDIASAFGLAVGDTLTVNLLGRDITAEIASVRDIDWRSGGINFTMVMDPASLAGAPHTFLATVRADPAAEQTFERRVADTLPNVTTIRVSDILATVNDILGQIGTAVRVVAAVTLVAGTLVLGGAMAAGHRRRVYDAVVFKVLGATRGNVLRAFLAEYGLLGTVTALLAVLFGTVAAWAVLTYVMNVDWVFLIGPVVLTAVICTVITLGLGFIGTWQALRRKPAPLLRNE